MTPSAPKVIGKYRIDGVIGRGAVGIVYRGHDTSIDRPVAVKTLRADVLEDVTDRDGLLQRFGREARLAGRCQHPNIVTVYDFVEHESAPYIIMEHVEAGTLEQVTRTSVKLPLRQLGDIMLQLLSALAHAHSRGVIHRDIKPANILCPAASSIKVTDFGVGRFSELSLTSQDGTGALGTPNYMSPEQFLGRVVDGRSDIFAAGVIFYQLLTGTKPFFAQDLPELMRKLLNDFAAPISSHRPELRMLDAVVQKALARNPIDRFQTAEEFSAALDAAITSADYEQTPPLDLTSLSTVNALDRPESTGTGLGQSMADRLTSETMTAIESSLARAIGPIARVVLKRAAATATDTERLITKLCSEIPIEQEKTAFRNQVEKWIRSDRGVAAAQLDAVIPDREIKRAAEFLMPYLGPVARVMAERHAATAIGRTDFYERLAQAIADPAERRAFLDRSLRSREGADR